MNSLEVIRGSAWYSRHYSVSFRQIPIGGLQPRELPVGSCSLSAILPKEGLFRLPQSKAKGLRCVWEEGKVSRAMNQKREFFRVAIERTGQIARGGEAAPCEVLDLTEKGFQLRTDLPVAMGESVELEFPLTKEASIQCTVEVTYVASPQLGARITRISPEHQRCLSQFIEQLNALNLTGF